MTTEIFKDLTIAKAYEDYDLSLRASRLITGLWIAIILIPIFGFLDYVMYPKVLIGLLKARAIEDVVLLVVLFMVTKMKNYVNVKLMGFIWAISIFILINYFIFLTEGSNSPYYAGLNLVIVVMSVVLPWTMIESVIACFCMMILYITTLVWHAKITHAEYNTLLIINNLFFLGGTSIICVVASLFNSKLRTKEFESNFKLEEKNIDLEQTLEKLKAAKAELIQSEKINALGHLSAGILHEINNPLNYCKMGLEILKEIPEVMAIEKAKRKLEGI
jgi:two-component system sensor histidine kinase PhcS